MSAPEKSPLLLLLSTAAMIAGLAAIFTWVPTDCSQIINGVCFQGTVQRIFYVHVPAAWIAYLSFTLVFLSSAAYLRNGSERWDSLAHAGAEVGVVFTGINLVTGMLWGKAVWGTFWQWEPRLSLTLVLFLIYLGYLAFRSTAVDETRGARIASVIGISGFAVIPLVHFSVRWWRGQHPGPVVIDPEGGADLPPEMLITLLFMLGVFTLLYVSLLVLRHRLGRLEQQVAAAESA